MAKFKTRLFNIKIEEVGNIEEKIRKKFVGKALNNFKNDILPTIERAINRAITDAKEHFQPHVQGGDELVGKLGVGKDGEPLTQKLENAWKVMLLGKEEEGSTRVSSLTLSLSKGPTFARLSFSIDRDKFYKAKPTNYLSFQSEVFQEIPWMKHFLRGMPVIDDYRYVGEGERGFKDERSRTGLGHMSKTRVPSRQFSLRGYGEQKAFGAIESAIKERLTNSSFRTSLKGSIKKALGRKGK